MTDKNTYGPAEIIKLVAAETGALPEEVHRLKGPWTQRIRRRLKSAGHTYESGGQKRHRTSLLGAQILIREMRAGFYRDLRKSDELMRLEAEERRGQEQLRQRREHFERTAPPEWVESARRPVEPVEDDAERPEPTPEYLEWEAEQLDEVKALNGIDERDELGFMIRALFFDRFRTFDLPRFRDDYAERSRLNGMLQYPGDGPAFEQVARSFNALEDKLRLVLEGRDLTAYLRKGR